MSPNYPDHYYSPTDIGYVYCRYKINVPEGKRIHLVFQELNLAFTDWGDFLEVYNYLIYFFIHAHFSRHRFKVYHNQIVDSSPRNYGKVLATFNAGDEAVAITTSGESMFVFFEANQGGHTNNRKAPAWKATYYVLEK